MLCFVFDCGSTSESHFGELSVRQVRNYEKVPIEPGSFGPSLSREMKFFQFVRTRLLKVTLTIAATLLLVHYWRQKALETHHFESLFSIDIGKRKMKLMETTTENVTELEATEELSSSSSSSHNSFGILLGLLQPHKGSLPDPYSYNLTRGNNETVLCPPIPPNLKGPIEVLREEPKLSDLENEFVDLEPGGMYKTKECKSRYIVAIIIPYRGRPNQLSIFLNNIHRLLMRQQLDYGIFVVEQEGNDPFNRGKLMNVGFIEASKLKDFDCYIFHDVDLLPEDDRNLYTCPEQPRHMSVAIDIFKYKLPYKEIFGGVSALSKEHFQLVNGFSNMFWGWGGEDDDMYSRIRRNNLHISRYPPTIARYTMLPHKKQLPNPKRYEILQKSKKLHRFEGLRSVEYEIKAIEFRRLYTWIFADIHAPR